MNIHECELIANNPKLTDAVLSQYRRHVEAGTVPTGWRKLLTVTGIEKYRHSSGFDDYKSSDPIYPAWTKKQVLRNSIPVMPHYSVTTCSDYINDFNQLNHFLEA